MDEKPYWWPEITDDAWVARIRADCPEDTADMDDDSIREYYTDGWKYPDTWDHLGDARDSHEKLADAFLRLYERMEGIAKLHIVPPMMSEQGQQLIRVTELAKKALDEINS